MRRFFVLSASLIAVAAASLGLWRWGEVRGVERLAARGQADLTLASDRLESQLRRYRELAVLMAEHPVLTELRNGGETVVDTTTPAVALLQEAADKTGAMGLVAVDAEGRVLAQAGIDLPPMKAEPVFNRALQGALGQSFGRLGDMRVYVFGAPAFGPDKRVSGVLMVVVNVGDLEWDWIGSNPPAYFTDAAGQVFISNRSELLFWREAAEGGLTPPEGAAPFATRPVGDMMLWRIDWGDYLPKTALHLETDLPVIGMRGHVLLDAAQTRWIAGLQALVFGSLALGAGAVAMQVSARRRILAAANAQLEMRVAERTEALSEANVALMREVKERKEAEAALKHAQAELVQAGKLTALGKMSAGISHELNQPLMAIEQFAENGRQFLDRGRPEKAADNLTRIADMTRRMARIIKNLRAFARQEAAPVRAVDLRAVIAQAVEMTEARRKADGIALTLDLPEGPLTVLAGEVRLGQVLVNLLTNAADAMQGRAERRISLTVVDGARITLSVADTGPGIAEPERMFDPFYSTKAVGAVEEGMGLGLSISYGLVQSFGGVIRGRNRPEGGAEMTVELERYRAEAAA